MLLSTHKLKCKMKKKNRNHSNLSRVSINCRTTDRLTCANDNNNNGSTRNSSGQKQVRKAAVEGLWLTGYPAEYICITWLSNGNSFHLFYTILCFQFKSIYTADKYVCVCVVVTLTTWNTLSVIYSACRVPGMGAAAYVASLTSTLAVDRP